MPMRMLKNYLDQQRVDYQMLRHPPTYTAQETAAAAHIPGQEMVKTVIVRIDDRIAMAAVPATQKVDLNRLQRATGARHVALCSEEEFADMFPECEVGAMPPFGNLFDMDVYLADSLVEDEEIAFNAGNHTELIRMSFDDFEELVQPQVVRLTGR